MGSKHISNLIIHLVIWDYIKNISFWKCADSILEVQKQVVLHQEWKIHKNAFSIPSKSVILTRPFLAFPCCGQVSLLHFTMQGITNFVSKIKVHIFWEGHKILRDLHQSFVVSIASQIICGDFAKFCGLLRIYELYQSVPNLICNSELRLEVPTIGTYVMYLCQY